MTTQQQNQPHRMPPQPARYSVRAETEHGNTEISIGTDMAAQIQCAEQHHSKHGSKVWVWSLKTGRTVFRLERTEGAGGGI